MKKMRPVGIIRQKNNLFALRILGRCGEFTTEELRAISQIAQSFGNGKVTATSRSTIEINGIAANMLEEAVASARLQGLRLCGTGKTVRAVMACKGTECTHGLYDVHKLACTLENTFLGKTVPKKFKIGVFGCPNSLGKARLQDVGFIPSCTQKGQLDIYVGGMAGRTPVFGNKIATIPENLALEAVKIILYSYQINGKGGERFGKTIERLGEPFLAQIKEKIEKLF